MDARENLKKHIEDRGITRAEFAHRAGIDASTLSLILSGGQSTITLRTAARIERATNGAITAASWEPTPHICPTCGHIRRDP